MAVKTDTDHTTGSGQVAVTGRYDSTKDSFGIDATYAIDDVNTVYGSYGVTEEKLGAVGIESALTTFKRDSMVDLTYIPRSDSARVKLAVRQGKVRVSAAVSFDDIQKSNLNEHAERYEFDAKLSGSESLKLAFDGKTKAAEAKVSRKLDVKNRLDAEYRYVDSSSQSVSLTFQHQYNKNHLFSMTTDYGSHKYFVEWECNTENGPWTVATSFPFNGK